MPELPEVETVRTELEPSLSGRRFTHVDVFDVRLTAPDDPREVAFELEGERVHAVERRGKYLIFRFQSGRALLSHLRMTGSFAHAANGTALERNDPYIRAVIDLDDATEVRYRDVRRFGTWRLLEPAEIEPYLAARLGPEPLGPAFTAAYLARRLHGRRAPIKSAILDQRTVAGLGNIYADEALWRARINPLTPARQLEPAELRRLPRAIRDALRQGIARGGATLRDYRRPDGEPGGMQHEFHVYGRANEPCDRCGLPIAKVRIAGRGSWFCPGCQVRKVPYD